MSDLMIISHGKENLAITWLHKCALPFRVVHMTILRINPFIILKKESALPSILCIYSTV